MDWTGLPEWEHMAIKLTKRVTEWGAPSMMFIVHIEIGCQCETVSGPHGILVSVRG